MKSEKYYAGEVLQIDGVPTVPKPASDRVETLTVTADTDLGRHFSYLDINEPATLARMRGEGLSEQNIADTPIHLSADASIDDNSRVLRGLYNLDTGDLTLYPIASLLLLHSKTAMEMRDQGYGAETVTLLQDADIFESASLSQTLWHELRHAKQRHCEGYSAERNAEKYDRVRLGQKIGKIAVWAGSIGVLIATRELLPGDEALRTLWAVDAGMASWFAGMKALGHHVRKQVAEVYKHDPHEKDAETAGEEAPSTAAIVGLRPHATLVRLPSTTISRSALINTAANLI